MRIFILSCNTGEGHNSAAKAIAEVLTARGIDSEITDGLAFLSPEVSKFISNWHVRIYKRAPLLFNAGYRMAENHDPAPEDASMVYKALSLGAKKLYAALEAGRYDAVVSTHVFASLVMRRVCQDYPISIPHYLVATDYTCSPYVAEAQADGYFIPDEKLADEFARCGIPKERLNATGIPERQIIFTPGSRSESRAALGIPADKRVALLMSGSMGCGPIKRLARRLTEMLPEDGMLIVICGHNEKLYESLLELGNRSNLRVLGFTKDVPAYMDAADLMLTKPGGLSSTEAAAKGLPMIFIDAVGGCEGRNLEFYTRYELAETADSVNRLAKLVCTNLADPEKLRSMSQALRVNFRHNGGVEICDVLTKGRRVST